MICTQLLRGIRNTDLYDKEEINSRCRHVTSMKFKGKINARIYCKEVKHEDKVLIIVIAELHKNKKNKKNKQKEINLIEKVGSYDYEIE